MDFQDGNEPEFFKVLFECLDDLRIPPVFVSKYKQYLPPKATIETDISEKLWYVKIEKIDEDYWMTEGWKEFVHENGLKFPKILVFRIINESRIKISVFDKDGCKIEAPLQVSNHQQPNSSEIKALSADETDSDEDFVDQLESVHINKNTSETENSCPDRVWTFTWKGYMRGHMPIKKRLWKKIGLEKDQIISLMNLAGCIHEVKIYGPRLAMGSGWSDFLDSCKLKLGKEYQFEFIPSESDHQILLKLSSIQKKKKKNEDVIFERNETLSVDFVWKYWMRVQMSISMQFFVDTGLANRTSVRVVTLQGEEFELRFYPRSDGRMGSGEGWAEFRDSNNFQIGNHYRFQFVPSSAGGLLELHELKGRNVKGLKYTTLYHGKKKNIIRP